MCAVARGCCSVPGGGPGVQGWVLCRLRHPDEHSPPPLCCRKHKRTLCLGSDRAQDACHPRAPGVLPLEKQSCSLPVTLCVRGCVCAAVTIAQG